MGRFQPTGRALRPIVRETYASDRFAIAEMAMHERLGIFGVAPVIAGPTISDPTMSGIPLRSYGNAARGGHFSPLTKSSNFR